MIDIPTAPAAIPFLGGVEDVLTMDCLTFATIPEGTRWISVPDGMTSTDFTFMLYDENEARKQRIADLEQLNAQLSQDLHDIRNILQGAMLDLEYSKAILLK